MRSSNLEVLTTALFVSAVSVLAFGCDASEAATPEVERAAPTMPSTVDEAEAAHEREAKVATGLATSASEPVIDEQPVLASSAAMPSLAAKPSAAPAPSAPSARRATADLRDPSLLPAGTPELNAEAFAALPLAKRDKAPIAGAGATGIHLDELAVGKGWASSRCEDLATRFEPGVDERVSVCFRVVHPRAAEQVTVEWARDGQVRQMIEVGVRDSHAYLTRAWMPVTEGRAGAWTATVKSEDGVVLGEVAFEVL